MPGNNPRNNSRTEEMSGIGHEFTKYLIQNGFIRMDHRRIKKADLIAWFLQFQVIHPSYLSSQDLIYALSLTHVLRKKVATDLSDDVVFKELIFRQHLENVPISTEDLIRPKIHVFVNPSKVFRSNGQKAPAMDGLRCKICNYTCKDKADMEKHLESDLHILRNQYRTEKNKFAQEIEGLAVSDVNVDLEKEEHHTYNVKFANVSSKVFQIVKTYTLVDLPEVLPRFYKPTKLQKGETFEYIMDVCFPLYGAYEYPIVTVIESKEQNTTFKLLSVPTFRVLKPEMRNLGPESPYKPRVKKLIRIEDVPFVSGVPYPYSLKYKVPLPLYPLPSSVNRILNKGLRASATVTTDAVVLKKMRQILCNSTGTQVLHNKVGLSPENYVDRFTYLLFIEEHWMNQEIAEYNRDDVELLLNRKDFFGLQVPGLSEGRPSILRGDVVYIKQGENAKCKYQGIVHEVQENTAYLALNGSFKYIAKQKVTVEFTLNRVSMRICHRALEKIRKENLVNFLFPSNKMFNALTLPTILTFRNRNIETNHEQMVAVNNIVRNTAYPAPYIIYGPPGTGKTATVVEAVTQLFFNARRPGLKICVCAPSNSAADLVAKRLLTFGVPKSVVFRIYSMSFNSREVPDELRTCSNFESIHTDMPFPSEAKVASKSIIVITPITAGRLYGVTGESYFDYLFFDEAGHAEETLTLIPITGLLKRSEFSGIQGSLVLAGDPKQLGPVIHSRLAVHLGLDMPLIERLMLQRPLYQRLTNGMYDNEVITKLLKNYRSHPVLLKLPNDLFYDNQLQTAASRLRTDCLSSWEQLPTKDFPLLFHGVRGKDDREANSPSYFNRDEIMVIGDYLKELVDCRIKGYLVSQDDIVILTPYQKQVQKIRQYLKMKKWDKVTVASVEKFQGQEKLIVIISTVRSRSEFIQADCMFGLGFLRNPKRFNVAITRAIALSIVVGNPNILQCDPQWRALIKFCRDNNSYRGILPSDEVTEDLDPNVAIDLDLSALTITADAIPADEQPSFPTDE